MHAPSIRFRRIVSLSAAPVAVLLAGLMVWQGSNAAFSSVTRNAGNGWETGSVSLSDDDQGLAMFSVQHLVPGQSGTHCIVVTANSSVPGTVKLYTGELTADGLDSLVKVSIEQGTGGTYNNCTGFIPAVTLPQTSLLDLSTTRTDFTNGALPWSTAGLAAGESKTYRFNWTFDTTSLTQVQIDALQGQFTGISFEWELQNL